MANNKTSYVAKERLLYRGISDEAVILDLDSGLYYGLDPVAALIWQLLAEGRSLEGICQAVVEAFDAPEAALRDDVEAFIDELIEAGILLAVSEPLAEAELA